MAGGRGGVRKGTVEDGVAERSKLRLGGGSRWNRKEEETVWRYEGKVDEGMMRADKDGARRGSSSASVGDSHLSSCPERPQLSPEQLKREFHSAADEGKNIPSLTSERLSLRKANFRLVLA